MNKPGRDSEKRTGIQLRLRASIKHALLRHGMSFIKSSFSFLHLKELQHTNFSQMGRGEAWVLKANGHSQRSSQGLAT